jgi:calcineurin-like phosphoesterase family protein
VNIGAIDMQTRIIKNLDEIYFTADLHLHHENIIEYCNRPFGSVADMDKTIISNWNNTVKHGDWVYILGDFCWGDRKMWCYFLNQLPGNKILIQGNHDRDKNIPVDKFVEVIPGFLNVDMKDPDGDQRITLCHYPMLSWYHSHMGAWQLFGHVHGKLNNSSKLMSSQLDVGIDSNNFTPVSYQDVKRIITKNLELSK